MLSTHYKGTSEKFARGACFEKSVPEPILTTGIQRQKGRGSSGRFGPTQNGPRLFEKYAPEANFSKVPKVLLLLIAFVLICGCAKSHKHVKERKVTYKAEGLASWYGKHLKGRATASGEKFDPKAMTAAHRTLPFGTIVKVTNTSNGRSVLVKINDRGPGDKDRLIDLTHGAAMKLGYLGRGLTRVMVEAYGP